jgi:hypothetical protein
MSDLKSVKQLPVRLVVDKAVVGSDTLVLLCGEHTVQVDLVSLFRSGVLPSLETVYHDWKDNTPEGRAVQERLNAMEVAS